MLFLMIDIGLNFKDKTFAYSECAICSLPLEELPHGDPVRNHVGGCALDLLNQICHSDRAWNFDKDMDVI